MKDGAKARVKEQAKQRQDNGKMDCLGASTVAETVSYHSVSIIELLSSFFFKERKLKKLHLHFFTFQVCADTSAIAVFRLKMQEDWKRANVFIAY